MNQEQIEQGITNESGLSLLELVIGAALLGMVLALGYLFFFFGTNTFTMGEKQSNAQQAVRLAADIISDEVRYANILEITNNVPNTFSVSDDFYYVFLDGDMIKYRKPGDTSGTDIENGIFSDFSLDLKYEKGTPNFGLDSSALRFTVSGSKSGEQYHSVDTEVLILNLNTVTGLVYGNAVRFKNP